MTRKDGLVDFGHTEEQVLIAESARKLVDGLGPAAVRAPFDPGVWRELAAQGFLSVALPERFGGVGGAAELAIICRAFGAGALREPYVGAGVFPAQLVVHAGSEAQLAVLLPAIAAGERILSVAYLDAPEAPGPTTYRRDGGAYVLQGRKCLALGAPAADQLIVSASRADSPEGAGLSLFLVDRQASGLHLTDTPLVDGGSCAEVWLEAVRVPEEALLGREGAAADALAAALRFATLGCCSQTAGAMGEALRITADYLKVRKQFGVTLSSFQVLRHRIADMTIDCQMAEAAILKMVASFEAPEQHDPDLALSLGKVMLSEAGHRVCSQAIQLHGGVGLTEECTVGHYFRHVTLNSALFGGPADHLARYGAQLTERGLAEAASPEPTAGEPSHAG